METPIRRLIAYLFVGGATVLAASPKLMDFLGRWEGVEYVVYSDRLAGGLPTVCKGITRHVSPYPVVLGERWSPEKCREAEEYAMRGIQTGLQKCLHQRVPQSVFDALSSHAWNFGVGRTCASQSVAYINAGDITTGCNLLAYKPDGTPNWSNVGSQFVQGLHNRRKAERDLCLSELQ